MLTKIIVKIIIFLKRQVYIFQAFKMANRSKNYTEDFQFHSSDTPRGMNNYDFTYLTKNQQYRLNNHKLEIMRENQIYLFRHPEVRATVQIILRKLLMERPSHDIHKFVSNWFSANKESIMEEINKYVEKVKKPTKLDNKTYVKEEKHVKLEETFEDIVSESSSEELLLYDKLRVVKDLLNETVEKVHEIYLHEKADENEVDDKVHPLRKSVDTDEDIMLDLGLDFELDFTGYHEEDDNQTGNILE